MKPLELKTFPALPEEPNPVRDGWDAWRAWDRQVTRERFVLVPKRLSGSELAAEYWAPVFIHFPDPAVWEEDYEGFSAEMDRRTETLRRFVMNPHYFEVDSE